MILVTVYSFFGMVEWSLFFFKQKSAYVMRIIDWSSDVCSSDLVHLPGELIAVDRPVGDVGRSEAARIAAGEGGAVALDGERRFLVAQRRFGDAIPGAVDFRH